MLKQFYLASGLALFLLVSGFVYSAPAEPVGVVIYTNTKNDGSFNQLAAEGSERAAGEFGISLREWSSTSKEETHQVLLNFAADGVTHVLILGFENSDAVRDVAQKYPDIKFTIIDAAIADLPNVRSVLFADDESGFLAGYVAGLKTETGTVGTIGGMDIPPVRRFMCGFAAGAKHAKSDVEILSAFIGQDILSFRDIQRGKLVGKEMFAQGADVVFATAGLASEGVAKAAKAAGAFVIMVDDNQNGFIPGTVLTSALKRVNEAAYDSWKSVADGTWSGGLKVLSAKDNGIGWAVDDHNRELVADIVDDVDAVTAALANGDIEIMPVDGVSGCAEVL
ncbi:BMP family lipoprotein [Roseibium sp.]|uniref:BMP family lipoprotein n=1 Tax=Roseibium sp. TaxID=1936156 RepID=UPI003B525D0D